MGNCQQVMAISQPMIDAEEGESASRTEKERLSVCTFWVRYSTHPCTPTTTQTAARHAQSLYPGTLSPTVGPGSPGSGSDQPRRACTGMLASIPRPCHPHPHPHPHPDNPDNPWQPSPYRKAIQTFPCQTRQTTSCSRLAAAATAERGRSSNGQPPARTVRHVKNLISLARLVSSLFLVSSPSPSLPPSSGLGDASPVSTLLCYQDPISPVRPSTRQAIPRVNLSQGLSSSAVQRLAYATGPAQAAAAPAFATTAATAGLRRPLGLSSSVWALSVCTHATPRGHAIAASTGQTSSGRLKNRPVHKHRQRQKQADCNTDRNTNAHSLTHRGTCTHGHSQIDETVSPGCPVCHSASQPANQPVSE